MDNVRVVLFVAFIFFGFMTASANLFWFIMYLMGCGVLWCMVHFFRWMSWLCGDDIKRMKKDKDKYYKKRGWK